MPSQQPAAPAQPAAPQAPASAAQQSTPAAYPGSEQTNPGAYPGGGQAAYPGTEQAHQGGAATYPGAQPGQPAQQQHYPGAQPGQQQHYPSAPPGAAAETFSDRWMTNYGDATFGGATSAPVGSSTADPSQRNVLTESTLIVSQKRKLIELTNEYDVYASDGAKLGAVVEVGQSGARKALRFVANVDQFLTHKLEIRDNAGRPLLVLTRPAKVVKSSVIVQTPDGQEIGRLVQQNVFGKIKFGLQSQGKEVGSLNAQNWRAWDFIMFDANGEDVARINKSWEGMLTTLFTTADNYAVHIKPGLPEPLHTLAIAAALCIDTALKQDERGGVIF